jgi:hypothetical protein
MIKTLTILSLFIPIFYACNQGNDKSKPLTQEKQNNKDTVITNPKSLNGYWRLF